MNKKIFFITVALLVSLISFSQQNFYPAEIIKSDSTKITGLIKYVETRRTPQEFLYKENENANSTLLKFEDVISVDVLKKVKYIKSEVSLSKSSNNLNHLDNHKEFELIYETKFIEELVNGDYKLYFLSDSNVSQFFYSTSTSKVIRPLLEKRYNNENGQVSINEDYKKEIYMNLVCHKNIDLKKEVDKLEYKEIDLKKYFTKVNVCVSGIEQEEKQKDYGYFQVKAALEPNFIKFIDDNVNFQTQNKVVFGLGAELEYVLPIYKYFFSLVVSPSFISTKNVFLYNSYDSNGVPIVLEGQLTSRVFSIPLNLRIYPINKTNFKAYISLPTFISLENTKSKVVQGNNEYDSFVSIPGKGFLEIGFRYKKFELGFRNYGPNSGYIKRNVISIKYNLFSTKK